MATYVLVHGAWSGAHGFRLVRGLLQDGGHRVFTPSMTGVGERVHLAAPEVGLGTHVDDLVNHLFFEDLRDVVLLGFSYGGCVVTGALERVAERVRHLVYLDAFVPRDGESVFSLTGRAGALAAPDDAWQVPAPAREFDDPAEGAFMAARRTPQPVRCFSEPVRLPVPLVDQPFPRTYVRATADRPDAPAAAVFDAAAERARTSPAWRYREVATNHRIASNRPQELAGLLLELA
jgi:pimeloyl-ACP methyl ester carboxylesterase